jgi:hypothetical protein
MTDMFAIVDKDGKIVSDACTDEFDVWVSFHSYDNATTSKCFTVDYKYMRIAQGFRYIPVTVTPKAEIDCRTCKLYGTKSGACTSVGVCSEQYFMYQPSKPVQLYTRESK